MIPAPTNHFGKFPPADLLTALKARARETGTATAEAAVAIETGRHNPLEPLRLELRFEAWRDGR